MIESDEAIGLKRFAERKRFGVAQAPIGLGVVEPDIFNRSI
jgi:hypothetical protein